MGISDSIFTSTKVDDVYRVSDGFLIGSLGIQCKHLVLASGIFTVNIPPPLLLAPIAELDSREAPLLVVGSGFSAADIIISAPPTRKIIHIYQWTPEKRPSPLRGCHHSAYPEYATVYRQMKLAAIASTRNRSARTPIPRRKSTANPFFSQRDWSLYEGLPNAEIVSVSTSPTAGTAKATIRLTSGEIKTYDIGGLEYVVGRRGTLAFLSPALQAEILSSLSFDAPDTTQISGRTLRTKAESSLEVARNVFITGSLTGDSLIRHAVGGCVFAAGRIMDVIPSIFAPKSPSAISLSRASSTPRSTSPASDGKSESTGTSPVSRAAKSGLTTPGELTNGHADLHLDRRKLVKSVEVAAASNRYWVESGWWAGGAGPRRPDL